jgi:ribosomal protein L12E/L44/L45/RPP1/RPP2
MLQQVELALRSDCQCVVTLDELRLEASASGLTGVEIDAALAQRSFDVRTSALVSLACAIKSANAAALESARQQAAALGWSEKEIAECARIAKGMIEGPTPRPLAAPSRREDRHVAAKQ